MSEHTLHSVHRQGESFPLLEQRLETMLEEWKLPGMALALVKDDELIFAKGYGVRTAGEHSPITEHTLFGVASVTKPFTATALGMLVDEGKIDWDDRVLSYLPTLQLYDPYVTQHLTVRDLLCARAGLMGGDLMHFGEGFDRQEVVRRLQYLKPAVGFRTIQGAYTFLFAVAGQVVEAVSGQRWDDFLHERLLTPLGMTSSVTSLEAFLQAKNIATPHLFNADQLVSMPWNSLDNVGPAGSLSSTAVDLAQWVKLHLAEGVYNQQQLLSRAVIQEMHKPQIVDNSPLAKSMNPDAHVVTYGLGWFLHEYQGKKVIECAGSRLEGMNALIAMMPEECLGLVLLSNADQARYFVRAVKFLIFDHYLHIPERDWSSHYLNEWQHEQTHQHERLVHTRAELEARRVVGTQPSCALEHYVGSYANDYYGKATVLLHEGHLTFRYGSALYAELEHWHYDTFKTSWRLPFFGEDLVTFILNKWGKVEEMKVSDFADFKRVASNENV